MHKNSAIGTVFIAMVLKKKTLWSTAINTSKILFWGKWHFATLRHRNFRAKKLHIIYLTDKQMLIKGLPLLPPKIPKLFVGIAESTQSKYWTDLMQFTLRIVTPDSHPTRRLCSCRVCYSVLQELKYICNLTGIFNLRSVIGVFCYTNK